LKPQRKRKRKDKKSHDIEEAEEAIIADNFDDRELTLGSSIAGLISSDNYIKKSKQERARRSNLTILTRKMTITASHN